MAKVYRVPEHLKYTHAPYTDAKAYRDHESAYIEKVQAAARTASPGDALAGERVNFQIADGYAQYVVWTSKPLSLVHLEVGDAYSIPSAHARGLRVADIKAMVKAEKAYAALFADKVGA